MHSLRVNDLLNETIEHGWLMSFHQRRIVQKNLCSIYGLNNFLSDFIYLLAEL